MNPGEAEKIELGLPIDGLGKRSNVWPRFFGAKKTLLVDQPTLRDFLVSSSWHGDEHDPHLPSYDDHKSWINMDKSWLLILAQHSIPLISPQKIEQFQYFTKVSRGYWRSFLRGRDSHWPMPSHGARTKKWKQWLMIRDNYISHMVVLLYYPNLSNNFRISIHSQRDIIPTTVLFWDDSCPLSRRRIKRKTPRPRTQRKWSRARSLRISWIENRWEEPRYPAKTCGPLPVGCL